MELRLNRYRINFMNQRTKIIATIGPSSESTQTIKSLIGLGVNIFRFNLKHNNYEWHAEVMQRVRDIAKRENKQVGILSDLQGPELRTGIHPNDVDKIHLQLNSEVTIGSVPQQGLANIPFAHLDLVADLQPGHEIYIDDGKIELEVIKISKNSVRAKVKGGGELGSRKSVSIPRANINVPTLNDKDRADIKFSIKEKTDFIALSFVRDGQDIATLRKYIKANSGNQSIISKIETLKSIQNLDEIIKASDGVMVARGDLGIEIPMERVPLIQLQIIKSCREQYKPVIVATQMLMSMVRNPIPSRAEVSDIANAVFEKTDALMLSDETASGEYPEKATSIMAKIARYNESGVHEEDISYEPDSFEEIIIEASVKFSKKKPSREEGIKGYIIFTESGKSARVLSRFRTPIPIFAFSRHESTTNQLTMSYGVKSYNLELTKDPIKNTREAIKTLTRDKSIAKGDRIIVIFGNNVGVPEANNTLSIIQV